MKNNNKTQPINIEDLFNNQAQYIIPLYQRNYEWEKPEIEQLINDIQEARERKVKHYYIGSLVVARRPNGDFEVIDGQQRLTTLNILRKCLDSSTYLNLCFEHRQAAQDALLDHKNISKNLDPAICQGFECTKEILNKIDQSKFKEYLNKNVIILQTQVPNHTDLNHYFEIMNTRGEQLEKHEILKARLMQKLNHNSGEQKALAMIWEACSDMTRFAVAGFPGSGLREILFGKNLDGIPTFDKIVSQLQDETEEKKTKTLAQIIAHGVKVTENRQEQNKSEGKLASIIDFPNFLMHVLAIWEKQGKSNQGEISLDEKFLLKAFEPIQRPDEIKTFVNLLLKCRLLFDRYILKMDNRDGDNGRWAIIQPAHSSEKTIYAKDTFEKPGKLKALQAMFQVSFTARNHKDWLQTALYYLCKNKSVEKKDFIEKLEKLAQEFYQARKSEMTYPYIQHYILNYLDYRILCVYHRGKEKQDWSIFPSLGERSNSFEKLKEGLENFEFFNRSSVEHYYPQTTVNGWKDSDLNSLGNLCLIGHRQNASLSNRRPEEKCEYVLHRLKTNTAESCKQLLMMMYDKWTPENARDHEKKMRVLLGS